MSLLREILKLVYDHLSKSEEAHQAQLDRIEAKLDQVLENQSMLQTEVDALVKRFDDATNVIAGRLTDLKNQVTSMGLDGPQEAALLAALDSHIGALEALGADPAVPVPPLPPAPPPVPPAPAE